MAKADISNWRTEVGYYVKGPGDTLTDWAVVEALRDFCKHTGLWRYKLDAINLVADDSTYDFAAITEDGENELDSIVWAKCKEAAADGSEADDDQYFDLDIIEGDWEEKLNYAAWSYAESTVPRAIMIDHSTGGADGSREESEKIFRLYPIPTADSTDGLLIKVQVKPAIGATTVPGILWHDYHKTVTHAAVSILQNMSNRPWSNKEHAKDNWNQYRAGRNNASSDRRYGRSTRSLKVVPRHFAGSRHASAWRSEKRFS
jgi:hypothetical protein